jgi:hypothetical protein
MSLAGGLIPVFQCDHERYRHHVDGGEQSRTLRVTWLRRTVAITYTSTWRDRRRGSAA